MKGTWMNGSRARHSRPQSRYDEGTIMKKHRMTAGVFVLVSVFVAAAAFASSFKAGLFNPPRPAPDFELQGTNGHELKMSQYRGKIVLLSFGYTSCQAVCPITL